MNKTLRTVLLIFFSAVFIFSAGMLIKQGLEYKRGAESYDEARDIIGLPDMSNIGKSDRTKETSASADPKAPSSDGKNDNNDGADSGDTGEPEEYDPYIEALKEADIGALRDINSDVIGYIYITDTDISYPIIYYKNNDYYLRRTWQKKYNVAGTIFMECLCSPDFSGFNTIIYGHRMNDGSMFGGLKYFNKIEYWQEHPNVYIVTEEGIDVYSIYAAYEVSVSGMTYRISFDDETKQEYIDFTVKSSVIDTGIVPTVEDQILTLSTCPAKGFETRWIVQAVKRAG